MGGVHVCVCCHYVADQYNMKSAITWSVLRPRFVGSMIWLFLAKFCRKVPPPSRLIMVMISVDHEKFVLN